MHKPQPTAEQFDAYRAMFHHFNHALFNDELPEVVLNFSRKARSMGFYAAGRWERADGSAERTDEISINPDTLTRFPPRETAATLVHEMCHQWRRRQPNPSRAGYHDHVWADKMESIGLMPSDTGKPGGKRVGQKMADYPIEGGKFVRAFEAMPPKFLLPWRSDGPAEPPRRGRGRGGVGESAEGADAGDSGDAAAPNQRPRDRSKLKYTCGPCGANVWGKPGLKIACIDCSTMFTAEE